MQRSFSQLVQLTRVVGWDRFVKTPCSTAWAKLLLRTWGAQVGSGFRARGRLRVHNSGVLSLGREVKINSGPVNYVGGDRRMALCVKRGGQLRIGDHCQMSNSTIYAVNSIVIHEHTFIGGGCDIYDHDFHPIEPNARQAHEPAPQGTVEIGPHAFIASHSIILKNVRIGEGAVIGAGSLVTRDVPAFEIWAGRPAKRIGSIAEVSSGNKVAQA
jgi:acetyltransferase-like isoleucine patch superfamily enzyme